MQNICEVGITILFIGVGGFLIDLTEDEEEWLTVAIIGMSLFVFLVESILVVVDLIVLMVKGVRIVYRKLTNKREG